MNPPRKRQRRRSNEGPLPIPHPSHAADQVEVAELEQVPTGIGLSLERAVCYGMVVGFLGTFTGLPATNTPGNGSDSFPVTIQSSHKFAPTNVGHISSYGKFSSDYIEIVQALLDESDLRLQASCTVGGTLSQKEREKATRFGAMSLPCEVSIIVYGPNTLVNNVGDFFQDLDMYLQDPKDCDWDVRYCNPHRLSPLDIDSCPMTSELGKQGAELDQALFQVIASESDVFEILDAHQDIPEAPQPMLILPSLKKHQKQALTFLQQREGGWNFDPRSGDFWDFRQTSQETFFVNTISQTCQADEPPQFCGGIVADPMGLGKTLTMIALIALEKSYSCAVKNPSLIIVPPPLLDTWEEQLNQHVKAGGLTWRRHYGKDKLNESDDIAAYDIVISTYNTVSADWGGGQKAATSLLFSTHWQRIILDEAHMIRNTQSQMFRAVCTLESTARWAVTGTPIQNRIGDLAALLKFIRAHPYDNVKQFESDIGQMWKSGNIDEAVGRLRKLSSGLIIRRPKTVIELPARSDLKFPIDFSPPERALYEKLKHQTITRIEEAFRDGDSDSLASNSYITVMQRINALRMICDLGMSYDYRHDLAAMEESQNALLKQWKDIAQETFNFHREVTSVVCSSCTFPCDTATAPFAYGAVDSSPESYFAKCLAYICSDCAQRYIRQNQAITCGHTPSHSIVPVSMTWAALEESGVSTGPDTAVSTPAQLSSKVVALISQLKCLPIGTKSVVFSNWRMTLNLVEMGLKEAGINHVRFDGKVKQQDRQAVMDKFRKDPTISVFLLTLSCGAVGLTLTEASRAYLIEPHWNPTIEEQALARVHRLGQQKEVTTIRFYVRDTFEERVLHLQRSKKKLEEVLLAPRKGGEQRDEGLNSLEDLRRLI